MQLAALPQIAAPPANHFPLGIPTSTRRPEQRTPPPSTATVHKPEHGRPMKEVALETMRYVERVRGLHNPSLDSVAATSRIPYIEYCDLTCVRDFKKGGYASVLRGEWHGKDVVLKAFTGFRDIAIKNACREMTTVQMGKFCPFVVAPIGYTYGPGKTPILISVYGGRTIWSLVRDKQLNDEFLALQVCEKLCRAVSILHQKALMLHGDLKGNNVLFRPSTGSLHLIDLGVAQLIKGNSNPYNGRSVGNASHKFWHGPEYKVARTLSVHTDTYAVGYILLDLLVPLESGQVWRSPASEGILAASYNIDLERSVLSCFNTCPTERPLLHDLALLFEKNAKKQGKYQLTILE